MKDARKVLALIIAFAMLFGMVSCSSSSKSKKSKSDKKTEKEEDEDEDEDEAAANKALETFKTEAVGDVTLNEEEYMNNGSEEYQFATLSFISDEGFSDPYDVTNSEPMIAAYEEVFDD